MSRVVQTMQVNPSQAWGEAMVAGLMPVVCSHNVNSYIAEVPRVLKVGDKVTGLLEVLQRALGPGDREIARKRSDRSIRVGEPFLKRTSWAQ